MCACMGSCLTAGDLTLDPASRNLVAGLTLTYKAIVVVYLDFQLFKRATFFF